MQKAVLKMQINKSDRNDAAGIARIMQIGWFKEVRVKDIHSHLVKALLVSRALLVKIKRDLENQIRGLLKNLGFVIGRAKFNVFAGRAEELIEDRPELIAIVAPLLKARKAIEQQIDDLDRRVLKLARHDPEVRRFMTVPPFLVETKRLSPISSRSRPSAWLTAGWPRPRRSAARVTLRSAISASNVTSRFRSMRRKSKWFIRSIKTIDLFNSTRCRLLARRRSQRMSAQRSAFGGKPDSLCSH